MKAKKWVLLTIVLALILRLPSLFEPFTYGDEGIYLTLGQAVRQGIILYQGIHDNKPPLLYLTAALAGNFEVFRLILFGWSLATIFTFYRLSQHLFPKKQAAQSIATVTFTILTSMHTFEGNVANAENFMMLPTIIGVLLVLKTTKLWSFILAGALFSLATLFKVPAAFDFITAPIILFFLFLEKKKKNYLLSRFHRGPSTLSGLVLRSLLLILGFSLPIITTLVYFATKNALPEYLHAAFFQNIPYLSSWSSGQSQISGLPLSLLGRSLSVFLLVIILFALNKKISLAAKITLTWFAFSWFAALLSSRPYPHYLLQAMPSFSLSLGLVLPSKSRFLKERFVPWALAFILVITFIVFRFWLYPNSPYYLNFYQYALRFKNHQEFLSDFDPRAPAIYQMDNYLKNHTLPGEKIFIWGNDPFVYALSKRLPVGRYTVAYHIIDFDGYRETMVALEENPPRYLIISNTENRPFSELIAFTQAHYFLEKEINGFQIFHRYHLLSKKEIKRLLRN